MDAIGDAACTVILGGKDRHSPPTGVYNQTMGKHPLAAVAVDNFTLCTLNISVNLAASSMMILEQI